MKLIFSLFLFLCAAAHAAPPLAEFQALSRALQSLGCAVNVSTCPSAVVNKLASNSSNAANAGVNSTVCGDAQLFPFFGCNNGSTSIDYLALINESLAGSFPSADLAVLTGLTMLRLEQNKIRGSLTSQIGKLTRLATMLLFDNDLHGALPRSLANLTRLTDFRVQGNNFSGDVPTLPPALTNATCLLQVNAAGRPNELGNCFTLSTCLGKCRCDAAGCLLTTSTTLTTTTTATATATTTKAPTAPTFAGTNGTTVVANSSTDAINGTDSTSANGTAASAPGTPATTSSSGGGAAAPIVSTTTTAQAPQVDDAGAAFLSENWIYLAAGGGGALLLLIIIIVIVCVVRRRNRDNDDYVPSGLAVQQPIASPQPYRRALEESASPLLPPGLPGNNDVYQPTMQPAPQLYSTVGSAMDNAQLYGQAAETLPSASTFEAPQQYQALPSHASSAETTGIGGAFPPPVSFYESVPRTTFDE